MGDYCAQTRSNYFRVKDEQQFEEFCKLWGLQIIKSHKRTLDYIEKHDGYYHSVEVEQIDDVPRFGFMLWGCLPKDYLDDAGDFIEKDFLKELGSHLADGEVAVCIEVGSDQMRCMNGAALAVNSNGETVGVFLDEIYELAMQKFGVKPSAAQS
jgi:hypothetical protein